MNIAYFGSPHISALLLELLIKLHINIPLVVTQPDKPVGKHLTVTPTPVKQQAQHHSIDVFDTALSKDSSADLIRLFTEKNIELALVFAYGALLKKDLLNALPHGFWNLHPSLLPRYRGPSPTAYPIIMEDSRTGISLMKMNMRMDAGDIIFQETVEIKPDETRGQLEERLTHLAVKPIIDHLDRLNRQETLSYDPQQEEHATYTRFLTREDGYVPLKLLKAALAGKSIPHIELPPIRQDYARKAGLTHQSEYSAAHVIYALYRGLMPWPGLWTKVSLDGKEKRLKLIDMKISRTFLEINLLQIEGKKRIDFDTFERAYKIFRGE